MNLTFLGTGSAFNPVKGNTSAYFIDNNELFLIDCGESVFERIITLNILNNIDKIHILITHTHSDHIGSIGSLIMYAYYKLHQKVNIILPNTPKYKDNIDNIITSFGCTSDMYNYINELEYNNKYKLFNKIYFIETNHCSNLNCYSIIFEANNGIIFYSGDTNDISNIKNLIDRNIKIDKIYLDTTTDNYIGNAHLYIGIINDTIPQNLKNKVYCMHINNDECIKLANKYGFNMAEYNK